MATNAFGAACHACYCAVFLAHAKDTATFARVRRRLAGALAAVAALVLFGVFAGSAALLGLPGALSNATATLTTDFLGLASALLTAATYASPLAAVGEVVASRSVDFMPLPLTVATLAAATCWSAFAFYIGDPFLGAPNYLGVGLGLAQVALYLVRPGTDAGQTRGRRGSGQRAAHCVC